GDNLCGQLDVAALTGIFGHARDPPAADRSRRHTLSKLGPPRAARARLRKLHAPSEFILHKPNKGNKPARNSPARTIVQPSTLLLGQVYGPSLWAKSMGQVYGPSLRAKSMGQVAPICRTCT